jgi:hypothetical protein
MAASMSACVVPLFSGFCGADTEKAEGFSLSRFVNFLYLFLLRREKT